MKRKNVLRAMHAIRAVEANARIGKLLLRELADIAPRVEKAVGREIGLEALNEAAERLIREADAVHDIATKFVRGAGIEIPPDDADGVVLTVQCCGK